MMTNIIHPNSQPEHIIARTIQIDAPITAVWDSLTKPDLIKLWIWESDVAVYTDWRVGSPIRIQGNFHGLGFENKGTVLHYVPERSLQYSYWSTLSEIADVPENYSVIEFSLDEHNDQTNLTFRQSQFATYAIFKHFEFYWGTTLYILKQLLETSLSIEQNYTRS
ncbi:SRPBCC family protein [Spirosoma gilvum]